MTQESVATAAQILDKMTPGWADKIDMEVLDMNSAQFCVLGQVYGSYFAPETIDVTVAMTREKASMGVFCDNGHRPNWRREVKARTKQVFVPAEWEKETVPA